MRFIPQLAILLLACSLSAQTILPLSSKLHSDVLNENRHYQVLLPSSYEEDEYYKNKHYPLLIVLDGDRLLPLVGQIVSTTSHASVEQIPEMIVVGISNTDRNRDFRPPYGERSNTLNGPERFLQFLQQELLPQLVEEYRITNCAYLLGHSFAGLFVTDAWLQNAGFCGYLAIDPSLGWANSGIVDKANTYLPEGPLPTGDLYIGQASNPFDPGPATNPNGQAMQALQTSFSNLESIRFKHDFFPEEDHFSIPLMATYHGLRHLFRDYLLPLDQLTKTPLNELISSFQTSVDRNLPTYAQLPALRAQAAILPPAKVLHQVALFLYHQAEAPLVAYQLLDWLLQNYPAANPIRETRRTFREELLRQGVLSN